LAPEAMRKSSVTSRRPGRRGCLRRGRFRRGGRVRSGHAQPRRS
jgi:hypothetical protein